MGEEMILNCTETLLAGAADDCETEYVRLFEFRFPWDDYHFSNKRFFVVRHRLMDHDSYCWDHIHNDLRSAMTEFGKEANRKVRYGDGRVERAYGPVEYCDDWWVYRNELNLDHEIVEPRNRSATGGDYGPSNPWDAPGMSVSDFIGGVCI